MASAKVATPMLQAFLDAFNAHDVDAIMARIVPFISGGIKALAAGEMISEGRSPARPRRAVTRGR